MKKGYLSVLFCALAPFLLSVLLPASHGFADDRTALVVGTLDRYAPYSSSKIKGGGFARPLPAMLSKRLDIGLDSLYGMAKGSGGGKRWQCRCHNLLLVS